MTAKVKAEHPHSELNLAPTELDALEGGAHEKLASRVGGAVTLAVGMTKVFSSLPGMKQLTAYWYHFVIMFEALFILTLLETGTRVARFIFEETVLHVRGRIEAEGQESHKPNWALNISTSVLVCFLWGLLLYTGSISSLWRMMGIANQLLATIALAVGTSYLLKFAPKRIYALCTGIPLVFVVATVFAAGTQSVLMWLEELSGLDSASPQAWSLRLMCLLASVMLLLTLLIVVDAARRWYSFFNGRAIEPVASAAAPSAQGGTP